MKKGLLDSMKKDLDNLNLKAADVAKLED